FRIQHEKYSVPQHFSNFRFLWKFSQALKSRHKARSSLAWGSGFVIPSSGEMTEIDQLLP
ncbi:MAG: hypothetical protein JWM33_2056, partial [Caulobacteraceae bacterium]|nr:hypothetical protein [Caulobacteraceae bacterium]